MTQYILLYHDYFDHRKWDSILSKIKNIEQFKQIDKSFLWFLYQKYLMLLYQGKSVKDLDFDFLTNFACLQDFTVKEVKYLIQQVNIQLTKHKFLDKNLRIPTDKIKKYNPNFNKIQQNSTTYQKNSTSVSTSSQQNSTTYSTKIQQAKKVVEKLRQHYYYLKRKNIDNTATEEAKRAFVESKKSLVENSTIQQ